MAVAQQAKMKHPAGLYVLFATEMWERFGFYTMMAMFTLYLKDKDMGFGWDTVRAVSVYSTYIMALYFSPIFGGIIADVILGYRNSVILGGIFFAAGYSLLTIKDEKLLFIALALIVIGNGFFKPNVSTMMGNLYPEGSPLKDSGFNIFYVGINTGAFLAPLVAEFLKKAYNFNIAFGAAAVGMVICLAIFLSSRKLTRSYEQALKEDGHKMVATGADGIDAPSIPIKESDIESPATAIVHDKKDSTKRPEPTESELPIDKVAPWKRIIALFAIYFVVIVFWMVFHQNGSTLTFWAENNTAWNFSGVISAAINPFWIITLTFPLITFWGWLRKKGKEPGTVTKILFGMIFTSIAYLIMYLAGKAGGDVGRVSPLWLISAYGVMSLGELMLSPMGLSLVSKAAPKKVRGLMMGFWFGATAVGNLLTMIGVYWDKWPHSQFFLLLAGLAFGTAMFLLIILNPLKKALPGV